MSAHLTYFDEFYDHTPRNDTEAREKLEMAIKKLVFLETHFRLARSYMKRERDIQKDFCSVLGKKWLRITNDAKNPLVIGKGAEDGRQNGEQIRKLCTCCCVGTMVQSADPNGGKQPFACFVANLSSNPDKNSYATLEHLFHSLEQSPIEEMITDKRSTKLEVTFDIA